MAIVVDPPYGSYTLAAEALGARYSCVITRQQVYGWARSRRFNHFPSMKPVKGKDGRKRMLLDLAEVITWYAHYQPRINTHPPSSGNAEQRAVEEHTCEACQMPAGIWCIDKWGRRCPNVHPVRVARLTGSEVT